MTQEEFRAEIQRINMEQHKRGDAVRALRREIDELEKEKRRVKEEMRRARVEEKMAKAAAEEEPKE